MTVTSSMRGLLLTLVLATATRSLAASPAPNFYNILSTRSTTPSWLQSELGSSDTGIYDRGQEALLAFGLISPAGAVSPVAYGPAPVTLSESEGVSNDLVSVVQEAPAPAASASQFSDLEAIDDSASTTVFGPSQSFVSKDSFTVSPLNRYLPRGPTAERILGSEISLENGATYEDVLQPGLEKMYIGATKRDPAFFFRQMLENYVSRRPVYGLNEGVRTETTSALLNPIFSEERVPHALSVRRYLRPVLEVEPIYKRVLKTQKVAVPPVNIIRKITPPPVINKYLITPPPVVRRVVKNILPPPVVNKYVVSPPPVFNRIVKNILPPPIVNKYVVSPPPVVRRVVQNILPAPVVKKYFVSPPPVVRQVFYTPPPVVRNVVMQPPPVIRQVVVHPPAVVNRQFLLPAPELRVSHPEPTISVPPVTPAPAPVNATLPPVVISTTPAPTTTAAPEVVKVTESVKVVESASQVEEKKESSETEQSEVVPVKNLELEVSGVKSVGKLVLVETVRRVVDVDSLERGDGSVPPPSRAEETIVDADGTVRKLERFLVYDQVPVSQKIFLPDVEGKKIYVSRQDGRFESQSSSSSAEKAQATFAASSSAEVGSGLTTSKNSLDSSSFSLLPSSSFSRVQVPNQIQYLAGGDSAVFTGQSVHSLDSAALSSLRPGSPSIVFAQRPALDRYIQISGAGDSSTSSGRFQTLNSAPLSSFPSSGSDSYSQSGHSSSFSSLPPTSFTREQILGQIQAAAGGASSSQNDHSFSSAHRNPLGFSIGGVRVVDHGHNERDGKRAEVGAQAVQIKTKSKSSASSKSSSSASSSQSSESEAISTLRKARSQPLPEEAVPVKQDDAGVPLVGPVESMTVSPVTVPSTSA